MARLVILVVRFDIRRSCGTGIFVMRSGIRRTCAAPARAPTRPPKQRILWEVGWGRGLVPQASTEVEAHNKDSAHKNTVNPIFTIKAVKAGR